MGKRAVHREKGGKKRFLKSIQKAQTIKKSTIGEARTTDQWIQSRTLYPLVKIPGDTKKYPRGYDNVPSPRKNAFHTEKNPGDTKKYPRVDDVFHPREKTSSIQLKPQSGDTKEKSREGNASENVGNSSLTGGSRGPSKSSPGGLLSTPPARQAWCWGPFFRR